MKLTIYRAIPLALAFAVAALTISGIPRFKHAHHGLDAVIGQGAWLGFLAGTLTLIALAAVALTRAQRARRPRGGQA